MKIRSLLAILALAFATGVQADEIGQYETCVNINGDTFSVGEAGCLGGDPTSPDIDDNIAASGFGSVIVMLTGVGDYLVSMFVDYDIDQDTNTFFNEFGVSGGALAGGQGWEIDEPGWSFGDIVDNFFDSTFDNSNGVPSGLEDDVSMGLGWDFSLEDGETAVISFFLSENQPGSGFWLNHVDPDSQYGYYFSSTLEIRGDEPAGVPEPGTLLLLGAGLLGLAASRRRRQRLS